MLPPWFSHLWPAAACDSKATRSHIHIRCYHAARNRSAPAVQQENIPMFGECRSYHLRRGNKMDMCVTRRIGWAHLFQSRIHCSIARHSVVGSMGLFERGGIQYPRHLCGNNLDPMHIHNYKYTYTFYLGCTPFRRSIPIWCRLAAPRRLDSWAGYRELIDYTAT